MLNYCYILRMRKQVYIFNLNVNLKRGGFEASSGLDRNLS